VGQGMEGEEHQTQGRQPDGRRPASMVCLPIFSSSLLSVTPVPNTHRFIWEEELVDSDAFNKAAAERRVQNPEEAIAAKTTSSKAKSSSSSAKSSSSSAKSSSSSAKGGKSK
jgi:hypothetical protein